MSFKDFVHKCNLKHDATSNVKFQHILSSIGLDKVEIYLRGGLFESDLVTVSLQLSEGTQWIVYINQNYFDSYGCPPPQTLSRFILKRRGHCLYSEKKIQDLESYSASYCLYVIFLTKIGLQIYCFNFVLSNIFLAKNWHYEKEPLITVLCVKYIHSANSSTSEIFQVTKPNTRK